jgi:hypothetical protein
MMTSSQSKFDPLFDGFFLDEDTITKSPKSKRKIVLQHVIGCGTKFFKPPKKPIKTRFMSVPLVSTRSADFQVCCIAGFQTRRHPHGSTRSHWPRAADLEIGGTPENRLALQDLEPPFPKMGTREMVLERTFTWHISFY